MLSLGSWTFRILRLVLVIATAAGFFVASVVALSPRATDLAAANDTTRVDFSLCQLAQRTSVYDMNGDLIGELVGDQNRVLIESLDEVSTEGIQSVLAVEDANFYQHSGINARALGRAVIQNVNAGGIEQGGSTITQQLIKECVLGDAKDLIGRKIPEAIMAMRLEDEMDKDEILLRYLNTVYFGGGAYGIKAAAELYYGIGPSELTWGQGAMLASIISAPVSGDPTLNPQNATERRDRALGRLVSEGHIDDEELQVIRAIPVPAERYELFTIEGLEEDYFLEEVKQILLDDERLGETRQERIDAVFSGGLRIYTTIDPDAQAQAERAVDDVLPEDERGFTMATASVEPGTGAVRAMVGGPGFEEYSKFNLATQKGRPTGSSFKTFVLSAAMEQGYVPNDTVDGSGKCVFELPNQPDYEAENFGGSRGGVGTIRSLTTKSSNCGFLRLGQIAGLGNVIDTANALGVSTDLPEVLSLPLGPADVTPLDMANSYATIANDGVRMDAYFIERVETGNGNILWEREDLGSRAISVQSARLVTSILEDNVEAGTGTAARLSEQPAAGKTGTAQNFADAWFVGFTPYLSTAVWMGHPDRQEPMTSVGDRSTVTGGSFPAMTWQNFNEEYHADRPVIEFEPPESTRSGKRLLLPNERKKSGSSSICGSTVYEIDEDEDGVVDSCEERPFYGWCPSIMVAVDDDNDGSPDRCVSPSPPTTSPPVTQPKPTRTQPPNTRPPKSTTTVPASTTTVPASTTTVPASTTTVPATTTTLPVTTTTS
ncbi:MAG: transglycosylase domain-containing protein [Acidobacteria bacterium]|nr:transglycosylase domain-containing protein [Acidobacteriota bacterium]